MGDSGGGGCEGQRLGQRCGLTSGGVCPGARLGCGGTSLTLPALHPDLPALPETLGTAYASFLNAFLASVTVGARLQSQEPCLHFLGVALGKEFEGEQALASGQ